MNIIHLELLDDDFFKNLYYMLSYHTIPFLPIHNRRLFQKHRASCWGMTKGRKNGIIGLSNSSIKYENIWEEIERIGNLICPFNWTSCHLNNNVICPPHKDKNNVGNSMIVSFGEYSGANLYINGIKYDVKNHPLIFNGALNLHWNSNDLFGNKYSLIYYNMKL